MMVILLNGWDWIITTMPNSLETNSEPLSNGSSPNVKLIVETKKQSGDLHVVKEPKTLPTNAGELRRSERLKKLSGWPWPNAIT